MATWFFFLLTTTNIRSITPPAGTILTRRQILIIDADKLLITTSEDVSSVCVDGVCVKTLFFLFPPKWTVF